jgi:hypothetical protein
VKGMALVVEPRHFNGNDAVDAVIGHRCALASPRAI